MHNENDVSEKWLSFIGTYVAFFTNSQYEWTVVHCESHYRACIELRSMKSCPVLSCISVVDETLVLVATLLLLRFQHIIYVETISRSGLPSGMYML